MLSPISAFSVHQVKAKSSLTPFTQHTSCFKLFHIAYYTDIKISCLRNFISKEVNGNVLAFYIATLSCNNAALHQWSRTRSYSYFTLYTHFFYLTIYNFLMFLVSSCVALCLLLACTHTEQKADKPKYYSEAVTHPDIYFLLLHIWNIF